MAGERTLPGIGLYGFWAAGSNGWKDQNDENLRKLSVLTQAAVISRTTAIPASPANGSVYLVPSNASSNANSFAIRDNGAFVYLPPAEGMLVYVKDTDLYVSFDGAAWNVLQTGGLADAPSDGKLYSRKNGAWAEVVFPDPGGSGIEEAPADGTGYVRKNSAWVPEETGGGGAGGIEEAPSDGKLYGRQNEAWSEVPTGDGTGLPDAPVDGVGYVRKDNAWVPEETGGGGGGGIEEAPSDGEKYVRQNGGWVLESEATGGEGAPFLGALIKPTTDQVYSTGTSTIRFAEEVYDFGGFYNPATPNVITIPVGVSKVRVTAQLGSTTTPPAANQFSVTKNGTRIFPGSGWSTLYSPGSGYGNPAGVLATGVIEVTAGDTLGLVGYTGGSLTVAANATWMAVEAVEVIASSARLRDLIDTAIPTDPAPGDSLVWDDVAKKWKPGVPVVAANIAEGVNKPFRGAMVGFSANKGLTSPMIPVLWDTAVYDTDALWSAASPGRFTVPAGVKKVRLHAGLVANGVVFAANDTVALAFRKNGARFQGGQGDQKSVGAWGDGTVAASTPVFPVVAGDYFEARYISSNATSKSMSTESWFAIEIVEVEEVL